MDTSDEIPLEDHQYFQGSLAHLESRHPTALLKHLERGTLTKHLREVTARAMQARAVLVTQHEVPETQADELVMSQIVADPQELSRLESPKSRMKLRMLLDQYTAALPDLPRTYLSQSETTE